MFHWIAFRLASIDLPRRFASRLTSGAVAILVCGGATRSGADDRETKELAVAAINGFQANLESFDHFTCRYTVTVGWTASLEDAIAKRFSGKPRIASGSMAKNGAKWCMRLTQDEATTRDLRKPPTKGGGGVPAGLMGGPIVPFMTTNELTSSNYTIVYDPVDPHVVIDEKLPLGGSHADFILGWLMYHTADDLKSLAAGPGAKESVSLVQSSPNALIKAVWTKTPGGASAETRTYTIDPARGYLPIKIESESDGKIPSSLAIVVSDTFACSRGRWFPKMLTWRLDQGIAQPGCYTRQFYIDEFQADKRPSANEMTITIPAGTVVNQNADSRNYFKTRQQESVSPEDLQRIWDLTIPENRPPLTDTAIRPPPARWPWYLGGAVGAVVVLLAAYRWIARRRNREA